MKLIVGLGNPGPEYESNRHNVGFCLIDLLGQRWSIELTGKKHQGRFGSGRRADQGLILLKPQTFMNRSGASVAAAMAFYNLKQEDLLVVLDDMALETGRLRLRAQGSAGGHNGLQDIIEALDSEFFARLRIGIGSASDSNAVGHVLGRFTRQEQEIIGETLGRATAAMECWLDLGIDEAMTRYNCRD